MKGSPTSELHIKVGGRSLRVATVLVARRRLVILLFAALTVGLAICATQLRLDAGFLKTLPQRHPYVQAFVHHQEAFGGANRIVVALRQRTGTIFDVPFFEALEGVTDEVFQLPGVDRATVSSLFTPNVRYLEVIEGGFSGGTVVPHDFEPTVSRLDEVRRNIARSPVAQRLVARDMSGALVTAKLVEINPDTGELLDYRQVAQRLESRIRDKYSSPTLQVHIIGFAKLLGEISDEAAAAGLFVLVTVGLTLLALLLFTRSWRITLITLTCAATAVVWQLGLVTLLGMGLDPMSVVVLFLVFAIAVSHGIQLVNAFRLAQRDCADSSRAAVLALSALLIPATVALFSDIAGFLTVLTIDIGMVREMALAAATGIGALLLINLCALPALLSYVPPPAQPAPATELGDTSAVDQQGWSPVNVLLPLTRRPVAALALAIALATLGGSLWLSRNLAIGDARPGAPALAADSRYNRDSAAITRHFDAGLDVLVVFAEGPPEACIDPTVMGAIDRLDASLAAVPGVLAAISLPRLSKHVFVAWNEGQPKWHVLPGAPAQLKLAIGAFQRDSGLLNFDCSVMPIYVFTKDHRAETITALVTTVKDFVTQTPAAGNGKLRIRLGGGNLGLMAATNETLAAAQAPMLLYLYASIVLLCLISFRSLRAVLCVVTPLALISLLAYALMAVAEIGLTVATLPVVALGAGIGVDYAIYVYSQLRRLLAAGLPLQEAYRQALQATGKAVLLTAATLGAGVGVWIFSGLKLQADMGLLLTFMFLGNMVAALVLLPALAAFLLSSGRSAEE